MTPSKTKLSFCHSVIEQLQLQNDRMTVLYSIHTLDVYSHLMSTGLQLRDN